MGFEDINNARRWVRMGLDIANQVENATKASDDMANSRRASGLDNEDARVSAEDRAFRAGMNTVGANGVPDYELKEMTCPNCGAKMSPDEMSRSSGALGSINCPYCGSEIVVNDEVKNAQYVHKVEVEQKRADIEKRRQQMLEEKYKSDKAHQEARDTIDTISSIEKGVGTAMKVAGIAIAIGVVIGGIIILLIIVGILKAIGIM